MANDFSIIALEHLTTNLLNADVEWLSRITPNEFSYWQNRLETRLSSQANVDESIKLFAKTIIANNIDDAKLAETVCASLNLLSVSWSFAYDYDTKTIQAFSSVNIYVHRSDEPPVRATVEPEPFQNAWLIIFTNTIWAQAAMSDELATEIAFKTKGQPAFSKPEHQTGIREIPDAFNYLPDAMRQRPEWIFDAQPLTIWPDFDDVANGLCMTIEEESEASLTATYKSTPHGATVSMDMGEETVAYWSVGRAKNNNYGTCFLSMQTTARQNGFSDFEQINKLNLIMHELPQSTQFGNWRYSNDQLTYVQLIPAGFIRSIEHSAGSAALMDYSPIFFERLALRSQEFSACFPDLQADEVSPETTSDQSQVNDIASDFLYVLEKPVTPLVENLSEDYEDATSNALILRRESLNNFFTICIFNPIGPTIHSLESYEDTDGKLLLLDNLRHPLYPTYLPVAKVKPNSKAFAEAIEAAIDRMFNHIPDYLDMSGCPPEIRTDIEALIKRKLHILAIEQNEDVGAALPWLKKHNQTAWQRVSDGVEPLQESSIPATEEQVDALFDYITSSENLYLFWDQIPDAWDGSINFITNNGSIGITNVGPFVLTYNKEVGYQSAQ